MQNKLALAIIVVVAIFLGVTISVQQANSPLMRRLVTQQEEILSLQKKLDRGGAPSGNTDDLVMLNKKVDTILTILKPIQQMQQAQQQAPQEPSDEYTKVHTIDIGQSSVKGNKTAPITGRLQASFHSRCRCAEILAICSSSL